jgi:hypothetical protein
MTMGFLDEIIELPIRAFAWSMEVVSGGMRGTQTVDGMVSRMVHRPTITRPDAAPGGSGNAREDPAPLRPPEAAKHLLTRPLEEGKPIPTRPLEEGKSTPDRDLSDDMLKLVQYRVLFVKRDLEYAFREKEELVPDNMSAQAFTAWKIAEFIQHLDEVNVPAKWLRKNYPRDCHQRAEDRIEKLPEEDKKYLRLQFEVLRRYPRERLRYEERHIEVLEGIRDALGDGGPPPPSVVVGGPGAVAPPAQIQGTSASPEQGETPAVAERAPVPPQTPEEEAEKPPPKSRGPRKGRKK